MRPDYHSALQPVASPHPPLDEFRGQWGRAFVWDIAKGLPPIMLDTADVLYSDLPWRPGYEKFAERAGRANALPYTDLMQRIGADIRRSGKPAVMVVGKQAVKALAPDEAVVCSLNGYKQAAACLWGNTGITAGLDSIDILTLLAKTFTLVGDPCCGYGWSGRVFVQHNKRYVLSDFNAECIGHIAANEGQWRGA